MSAASTDYFTKVGSPGTATSLAAPGHTVAGTSITVGSTSNWPTDTGAIFAIDTVTIVNGVEVRDVGSYTEWEGVVTSATTIGSLVLRYGTDQNYPAGSTTRVYIPVAGSREDRRIDGILVSHKQNGQMIDSLPLTTPKITTSINDANGNEVIKTPATSSAVNEITVTNAATGNAPSISATGGDTNVSLNLVPKGSGTVQIDGVPMSGAWTSWTPTWGIITVGNATVSATYQQIGNTVNFQILLIFGTTTAMGTGFPTFTLPLTASSFTNGSGKVVTLGSAMAYDTSASLFFALACWTNNSTTVGTLGRPSSDPVQIVGLGNVLPLTWATGDAISIRGSYEVA